MKQASDVSKAHSLTGNTLKGNQATENPANTGLTDDERVSREDEELGDEPRVTPGPADADRLTK